MLNQFVWYLTRKPDHKRCYLSNNWAGKKQKIASHSLQFLRELGIKCMAASANRGANDREDSQTIRAH